MALFSLISEIRTPAGRNKQGDFINNSLRSGEIAKADVPALIKSGKATIFLKRLATEADAQAALVEANAHVRGVMTYDLSKTRNGGFMISPVLDLHDLSWGDTDAAQ